MLEQHNFFTNRGWIVKKVIFVYLLYSASVVNFVTNSIYVDKMEKVSRCDYFGAVIEKNSECSIRQFVSETILRAEINKFNYKLSLLLI